MLKDYTVMGDIEFTPSVLVYGNDKTNPTEYLGDYEEQPISEHVCTYCDDNGFERRQKPKPRLADLPDANDDFEVDIG